MNNRIEPVSTWVLLRGLSREKAHWGDFPARLQQQFPDYRFVCLDLPGCGEHYQQPSPQSIGEIRQQLQAELKQMGENGPVGLIGLSLGGMIALDWLEADCDTVRSVVVINSSANTFSLLRRLKPLAVIRCALVLGGIGLRFCEKTILQMVSCGKQNDETVLAEWVRIQQLRPVSRNTVYRQLKAAAGFTLPKRLPVDAGLVLSSRQDGMVSPQCSEGIAQHYGWPLKVHPEAGHDLPLDDPEWVVVQIHYWLERQS